MKDISKVLKNKCYECEYYKWYDEWFCGYDNAIENYGIIPLGNCM